MYICPRHLLSVAKKSAGSRARKKDEKIRDRMPVRVRTPDRVRCGSSANEGHPRQPEGQRIRAESERQRGAVRHRAVLAYRGFPDGAGVARLRSVVGPAAATSATTSATPTTAAPSSAAPTSPAAGRAS